MESMRKKYEERVVQSLLNLKAEAVMDWRLSVS